MKKITLSIFLISAIATSSSAVELLCKVGNNVSDFSKTSKRIIKARGYSDFTVKLTDDLDMKGRTTQFRKEITLDCDKHKLQNGKIVSNFNLNIKNCNLKDFEFYSEKDINVNKIKGTGIIFESKKLSLTSLETDSIVVKSVDTIIDNSVINDYATNIPNDATLTVTDSFVDGRFLPNLLNPGSIFDSFYSYHSKVFFNYGDHNYPNIINNVCKIDRSIVNFYNGSKTEKNEIYNYRGGLFNSVKPTVLSCENHEKSIITNSFVNLRLGNVTVYHSVITDYYSDTTFGNSIITGPYFYSDSYKNKKYNLASVAHLNLYSATSYVVPGAVNPAKFMGVVSPEKVVPEAYVSAGQSIVSDCSTYPALRVDYFGKPRNCSIPTVGPIEITRD